MNTLCTVLNVPELLARVENDRELLGELVSIFKEKLPEQLNSLRQAVENENMAVIAAAGHSFKGLFSNLGAARAVAASEHLEAIGREGKKAEAGESFLALEKEIQMLLPELESCAAETGT